MTKVFSFGPEIGIPAKEKARRIISALGGLSRIVHPGNSVLIKPNFVAPFPHAVTSFEILEAIVEEVLQCGGRPVIGESSGFEFDTEETFRVLGVHEFARRNHVEIVNFDTCEFSTVKLRNGFIREVKIPKIVQQADVIINVPKLKRHSLTTFTNAVKNLFGILHRDSRRKIHALGLGRGIFEFAQFMKSDLVIVDGAVATERAVYGARTPLGYVVGGTDIFAVDMYCCELLQINHREVGHMKFALEEGLLREEHEVISLSEKEENWNSVATLDYQNEVISKKLRNFSYQLMYLVDIPYSKIWNGKSVIPHAHFYFGIRPKLDHRKCTECGECLPVCPVDAINLPEKRIVSSLCMKVRCLKCVEICPESAISIRGRKLTQI